MCFLFSVQFLFKKFLILKMNSARYCHKYDNVVMQSTRYYFRILIKLEFSR